MHAVRLTYVYNTAGMEAACACTHFRYILLPAHDYKHDFVQKIIYLIINLKISRERENKKQFI